MELNDIERQVGEVKVDPLGFSREELVELRARNAALGFQKMGTAARDAQAAFYTYAITSQMAIIKAKRIAKNRRLINRQRTRRNK